VTKLGIFLQNLFSELQKYTHHGRVNGDWHISARGQNPAASTTVAGGLFPLFPDDKG
jgi:hypothetical protein